MGCTRVVERVEAAVGQLVQAPTQFENVADVPNGGVLWAVPALLSNGLLRHNDSLFQLAAGYYGVVHVFVLLAMMALTRVRTCEQLRYEPCGEWGKLLGLDRIPEVRTLRNKIKLLAKADAVKQWSAQLCQDWMQAEPEATGQLYVDGHVRTYHGSQTRLPRRYVSRERLCLRGMSDYWVNDKLGRPFFVVSTAFTDGLLAMLRDDIVPRLLKEVPNQPSQSELEADPHLSRFTLVFDREGYSPQFFKQMRERRIACVTYHKHPKQQWPEHEFIECEVELPYAGRTTMRLAERGTLLGGMWLREIRKLCEKHQTSILSTEYRSSSSQTGAHMFSRWSQENFFRYMTQHFDLDGLVTYMLDPADETKEVVNPARRQLEGQVKSKAAKHARKLAQLGKISLPETTQLDSGQMAKYESSKGQLREQVELLGKDLVELKAKRQQIPRHVVLKDLPEDQRFAIVGGVRKQFIDTIRMIAYRAETAMALQVREVLARTDDARSLLREIFTTEADLIPNLQEQTLTVSLHHLTNRISDNAARHLAKLLNETQTLYPGTNLRLIFKMVSDPNPPDQEV